METNACASGADFSMASQGPVSEVAAPRYNFPEARLIGIVIVGQSRKDTGDGNLTICGSITIVASWLFLEAARGSCL